MSVSERSGLVPTADFGPAYKEMEEVVNLQITPENVNEVISQIDEVRGNVVDAISVYSDDSANMIYNIAGETMSNIMSRDDNYAENVLNSVSSLAEEISNNTDLYNALNEEQRDFVDVAQDVEVFAEHFGDELQDARDILQGIVDDYEHIGAAAEEASENLMSEDTQINISDRLEEVRVASQSATETETNLDAVLQEQEYAQSIVDRMGLATGSISALTVGLSSISSITSVINDDTADITDRITQLAMNLMFSIPMLESSIKKL